MDYLRKVNPGDPLRFPANAYNAFVDAAVDYRRRHGIGNNSGNIASSRDSGIIHVKNDSGSSLARLSVLEVGAPAIGPADNENEFVSRLPMTGAAPSGSNVGNFCITLEPLASGSVGLALAAGVTAVQLDVQDAADEFADTASGVTDKLRTGTAGAALILWKASGTGTKWGVVRFGAASGGADTNTATLEIQQNGTTVVAAAEVLNIHSGKNTHNILEFVSAPTNKANLQFKVGLTHQVLQTNSGGNVIWDYVRAH